MPRTPKATKPSTPRLSEVAKHLSVPDGITATGWPDVERTCRLKMGVEFDAWQDAAGKLILAKRADGHLAAMIDGVGMSLPRQVGKTYLVGSLIFGLCVNTPGLLVIWSAHHARTHGETFLAMQGFAQRAKVAPFVDQVFKGSGDEEIRFHNGSRILFGARERGFGRGIPGVDILIMDEAQILSDRAMSNMLATLNTSQFGLQLYIGTPPKPGDDAEAFTRMRTEALAGTLVDGAWIEFGADDDADDDDRAQWRKANPSFPTRTPVQSMLRLKRKLTPADWRREGQGIWDEVLDAANAPYPVDKFAAAVDDARVPADGSSVAWSFAVSWDRRSAHVSKAARAADGTALARVVFTDVPTSQVVELLAAEVLKGPALGVAIQGGTAPVASLAEALTVALDGHCEVVEMSGADCARACGMAFDALSAGAVKRASDGALDEANRLAVKRSLGSDGWAIDRKRSKTDVANLVSWTGALWLLLTQPEPGEPGVWFL